MPIDERTRKLSLDLAIAVGLNLALFLLAALVLWPFGKSVLAWQLTKGFFFFSIAVLAGVLVTAAIQKVFRVEDDPPSNAFVLLNLIVSAVIQVGWSAFAALAVLSLTPGASLFAIIVLHAIGFISCPISKAVTDVFFSGTVYAMVNAALTLAAYIVFATWPGVARTLYGWLIPLS